MYPGENFLIMGQKWARIYFIENEGMAYGLTLGGDYGKLFLSLFRVIMIFFLGYLLFKFIKNNEKTSLLISFSMIFAGAVGNMIDSSIYGLIFTESIPFSGQAAHFTSFGNGYAGFLHGKVVDMLHFPMINTYLPSWLPIWGGQKFVFFQPIFNIADSSITIGVASLLIFNRSFFGKKKNENPANEVEINDPESLPNS